LEQHPQVQFTAAEHHELVGVRGRFHAQRHVVNGLAVQALANLPAGDELAVPSQEGRGVDLEVMLMVGSSTVRLGKGSGLAGSHRVSDTFGSAMPAKATMSPALAASTSTRVRP